MRFRKTIAICLVFCVLITTGIVSSLAASNPIRIYSDEVNAKAGQVFSVPIMISGNTGISAIGLKLTYDKDAVTPISVKKGSALSSGMTDNSIGVGDKAEFSVLWYNTKNITNNGVIFFIEFIANSSANNQTTVSVEIDTDNTFDSDYNTPSIISEPIVILIDGENQQCTTPDSTGVVIPDGSLTFYSDTTFGVYNKESEIPIKIKNNNGLMGFKLNLFYDSNSVDIEDVLPSALTKSGSIYFNNKPGVLSVLWNNSEQFTDDGTVFTVLVKYKKALKTDISIVCSGDDTFNGDYISPETECKNVNIGVHRMGDVNLDGVVNVDDATDVQKHVALLKDLDQNALGLSDCSFDGIISVSDATAIQQAIVNLINLD